MKRKAFTLIELLVVIAIISILASILFPVFARARENARRTSCASNLKQIGLGVMQYVQDYDEYYPQATRYLVGESGSTIPWFDLIDPYVKSYQVFRCPSSSQGYASDTVDKPRYVYAGNYGANLLIMRWYKNKEAMNMAAVINPASTFLIMDCGSREAYPTEATAPDGYSFLPGMGALGVDGSTVEERFQPDFQSGRHLNGINMSFADGHVKWLSTQRVYAEAKKMVDKNWAITDKYPSKASMRTSSDWNPWVENSDN